MTDEEFTQLVNSAIDTLPELAWRLVTEHIPVIVEPEMTDEVRKDCESRGNIIPDLPHAMYFGPWGVIHGGVHANIRIYKNGIEASPKQDKKKLIKDSIIWGLQRIFSYGDHL